MTNLQAAKFDRAHVLRPWANMGATVTELPLVIARGAGAELWDAAGNRYVDAVGGLWCTNIGLGRREVAQAIAEQAERLAFASTFVDMTTEPTALLSARLAEIAPTGLGHVHYTTGGSTAIDSAFRMACFVQRARGHSGRTQVIARRHSYHGSMTRAAV
ncbi:MAG: aminotransferase class III-fold pyridoxal phosphate-dependent enzyme, partial [Pseudomonadota bacterium]